MNRMWRTVLVVPSLMALSIEPITRDRGGPRDTEAHGHGAVAAVPRDSVEVRARAEALLTAFLGRWQAAWLSHEETWIGRTDLRRVRQLRAGYGHCDTNKGRVAGVSEGVVGSAASIIESRTNAFSKCPSWMLGPAFRQSDEADGIDASLSFTDVSNVRAQRAALLHQLDSLQQFIPADAWLLGQRVRMRIDQGEPAVVTDMLANCSLAFWCAALRGYALAQRGDLRGADSLFSVATAALAPNARCSWTDIAVLLPGRDVADSPRSQYEAADCVTRDSLAHRYWWLADPLLYMPGNERRATHFMRHVMVLLKSGLRRDERYSWTAAHGSDVPRELLLRYGWPTASVWMGRAEDRSHDGWLLQRSTPVSNPYSTAEYSAGRVSFGPTMDAVHAPFAASAAAWTLRPPQGQIDASTEASTTWWPTEHMRYAGDIHTLTDAQVAMLRREHSVQLAVATSVLPVATPLVDRLRADSAPALLVVSPAPDTTEVVGAARIDAASGRLAVQGYIQARPMVVGVEAARPGQPHDAVRLRVGITPPATLAALPTGAIAVSDPVFFAPGPNGLPADAPALFSQMLPSTTIPRASRLGVFWETYGVPVGDSVRFTVTVSRLERSSALERLTETLRLREAPVGALAVSWQDPDRPAVTVNAREVPIMPRSLVLDLQPLARGAYRITVEAVSPGRTAVRRQRDIRVQ